MNLLRSINKRYLLISFAVLVTGGICFYFIIKGILDDQLTEDLFLNKEIIEQNFTSGTVPDSIDNLPGIRILPSGQFSETRLRDTVIYNILEKEYEPQRELSFGLRSGNKIYNVTLSKTLYEKEDLIFTIFSVLLVIMIIQLLLLVLLNNYFTKKLLVPFFSTVKKMGEYTAGTTRSLALEPSIIDEFTQLNRAFESLHRHVISEYDTLKEFTENASHELQTPLTILQNKIDLLMQEPNLTAEQILNLNEMGNSIHRLSKMSKQLLMLAKIDNNQFAEHAPVDIAELIHVRLDDLKEISDHKNINIRITAPESLYLDMNGILADVAINNLLSNAIRYTNQNGNVFIQLDTKGLIISNSGEEPLPNQDKMFNRFYKPNARSSSNGLGLSLVNKACLASGFTLQYNFADGMHQFIIGFGDASSE